MDWRPGPDPAQIWVTSEFRPGCLVWRAHSDCGGSIFAPQDAVAPRLYPLHPHPCLPARSAPPRRTRSRPHAAFSAHSRSRPSTPTRHSRPHHAIHTHMSPSPVFPLDLTSPSLSTSHRLRSTSPRLSAPPHPLAECRKRNMWQGGGRADCMWQVRHVVVGAVGLGEGHSRGRVVEDDAGH